MEVMVLGFARRLRQASQAASTMAPWVSNTRFESQFWRRYCQMFSTGLSSGAREGRTRHQRTTPCTARSGAGFNERGELRQSGECGSRRPLMAMVESLNGAGAEDFRRLAAQAEKDAQALEAIAGDAARGSCQKRRTVSPGCSEARASWAACIGQ